MPTKRKAETALEVLPPKTITLTEDQFRELGERIESSRKPNPMPWAALIIFLVLVGLIGGMWGMAYIMRPEPVVIPTYPIQIPFTVTPQPTVTKTPTSTSTPDMTRTRYYHPSMELIRYYFERLEMADYGSAWHSLTERCKYKLCWDSFKSDYKEYIEVMRRYGQIRIQELRPEYIDQDGATAFVILFFKKEMQPHSYRFFLLYDGDKWLIDSIEFISLVK